VVFGEEPQPKDSRGEKFEPGADYVFLSTTAVRARGWETGGSLQGGNLFVKSVVLGFREKSRIGGGKD